MSEVKNNVYYCPECNRVWDKTKTWFLDKSKPRWQSIKVWFPEEPKKKECPKCKANVNTEFNPGTKLSHSIGCTCPNHRGSKFMLLDTHCPVHTVVCKNTMICGSESNHDIRLGIYN